MAGKNHFCTHCGTYAHVATWIEIELVDVLYNARAMSTTFILLGDLCERHFITSSTWQQSRSKIKCSVESEGSDGSEIWIPILTNRTCPKRTAKSAALGKPM